MYNLVEEKSFRPILRLRACLGMKIVEVLDNDAITPRDIKKNSTVYTTDTTKFPAVFQEGIVRIEGQYNIKLDPIQSILSNMCQAALDDLVTKEVIAEVKQLLRDRFMNLYLYKLNLNRRIQLNIGVTAFSQKLQLVSTVNCQLSTVNCQLSTVNCVSRASA